MKNSILLMTFVTFSLCSCAVKQTPVTQEDKPFPSARPLVKPVVQLSQEEQQKRSLELFNQLLEITQGSDRSAVLDTMTELYFQIIDQFPEAPLAQESYWRLVEIYLKDYKPPRRDDALALYQELNKRYPDSPIKSAIETSIERFYYMNEMWNDLIGFEKPYVEEFIKSGNLPGPTRMFLYSEAKLNLKDIREAQKGYKIVIKFFPQSSEAKIARERMKTIGSQEGK